MAGASRPLCLAGFFGGGETPGPLPILRSFFCIGEFFSAAPVAVFLDELARLGEFGFVVEQSGAVQVDVGEVERHRPALGDLLGFVEVEGGGGGIAVTVVVQGGGEEGSWELVNCVGLANAFKGLLPMRIRELGRRNCGGVEQRAVEATRASVR